MRSVFLLGLLGACTPPNLLIDGGLDLWCGDQLCNWEIEEGEVAEAPTWHARDVGAELIGDRVAISQPIDLSLQLEACLELAVVHQGGADAPLTVTLDLLDDGTDDYTFEVPPSGFDRQIDRFQLPDWFVGSRIRLVKTGATAVLGAIALSQSAEACEVRVPTLLDRPAGAPCDRETQCADGYCTVTRAAWVLDGLGRDAVCSSCGEEVDCLGPLVCGLTPEVTPTTPVFAECVEPAGRVLGEHCLDGGECGTGVCCEGRCSECCDGAVACAADASCRARTDGDPDLRSLAPFTCDLGARPAGEPCLLDGDCGSGTCRGDGNLSVCALDGRTCASEGDCPLGVACERIGARDGVCL